MKKWIVFLSVSCALLIAVIVLQSEHLHNVIKGVMQIKAMHLSPDVEKSIMETQIVTIIKSSIAIFFLVVLFGANLFLLVSIALRKITPLSVSENLAAWKEKHAEKKAERKQRQLEKAQAKVEQLKSEIQKDDN